MAGIILDRAVGLYTATNPLSATPPGALVLANNVTIRNDGLIEPRPGFTLMPGTSTTVPSGWTSSYRIVGYHPFDGKLVTIVIKDPTAGANIGAKSAESQYLLPGTYWVGPGRPYGVYSETTYTPMRSFVSRNSLFLTNYYGVYKITSLTNNEAGSNDSFSYNSIGNPTMSGVVPGMPCYVQAGTAAAGVDAYSQVSYRAVLGYYDSFGNEILGAPGGASVYTNNTTGAVSCSVYVNIPNIQYISNGTTMPDIHGVTTEHFVRIYRTKNSGGVNIPPGDDHYLVSEISLNGSEDTNSATLHASTNDRDLMDVSIRKNNAGAFQFATYPFFAGKSGTVARETALNPADYWTALTKTDTGLSGVNWYGCEASELTTGYKLVGEGGKSANIDMSTTPPNIEVRDTPTTNDLYAITCYYSAMSGNVFWAVGEAGTILKYSVGAWAAQTSGTAQDLNDVFAIDANVVYAVGNNGTVLYTSDGGTNWSTLTITGSPTTNLYGVDGYNSSNIAVVGASGFARHYTGGLAGTWTDINQSLTLTGDLYAVAYRFNNDTVFVGGTAGKIWCNDANISPGGVDGTWTNNGYPLTYAGETINAISAAANAGGTVYYAAAVGTNGLCVTAYDSGPAIPAANDWVRTYPPTFTNLNTQIVHYEDSTPDAALGPPLYTNVALDGITQANTPPPISHDAVYWNDRAWYAVSQDFPQAIINLLGTSSVSDTAGSLDANDYLTLTNATRTKGLTIQLGASEDLPNGIAKVYTDAGSVSTNIKNTLISIANAINMCSRRILYASRTTDSGYWTDNDTFSDVGWGVWQAEYVDGDGFTGSLVVTLRAIRLSGYQSFNIDSNDPMAFSPALTNGNQEFRYSNAPNRLYYSKLRQPEAVPRLNYLDIGKAGYQILRIVGMGDRLYVFKEDGLYTVAGDDFFRVSELDHTAVLAGLNTPAILGNKLFALTSQGVVAVNESGVAVVSAPIADQIKTYLDIAYTNEDTHFRGSFGVGDETNHNYLLFVPDYSSPAPTGNGWFYVSTKAFVFNDLSRSWTTWTKTEIDTDTADNQVGWYAGCYLPKNYNPSALLPSNTITLSDSEDYRVLYAQKYLASSVAPIGYFDNYISKTASAVSAGSNTVTFADVTNVSVGDLLVLSTQDITDYANVTKGAIITAINGGVCTVSAGAGFTFTTGTAYYCYKAIDCQIQYNDVMPDKDSKHFSSATYIFKRRGFYSAYSQMGGEWQNFGGGDTLTRSELIFSDRVVRTARPTLGVHASSKRVLVPKEIQRGSYLSVGLRVKEAGSYWALAGIAIELDGGSDRNNR